jgi:hypothetical protein
MNSDDTEVSREAETSARVSGSSSTPTMRKWQQTNSADEVNSMRGKSISSTESVLDQDRSLSASSLSGEELNVTESITTVDHRDPEFSPAIGTDERLAHPERWLARLKNFEYEVMQTSNLRNHLVQPSELWDHDSYVEALKLVVENLEVMHTAKYSDQQMTLLVEDSTRPNVAVMKNVTKAEVEGLRKSLENAQDIEKTLPDEFQILTELLGLSYVVGFPRTT